MNGFSASDLMGGGITIEDVQGQSDTVVSRGSRSKAIPNAEQLYDTKKAKELKKYAIMALIAYYVFC